LRIRVPSTVEQVTLTDPAGVESRLEARGGVAIIPHPDQPGFYLVSYGGARPGVALSVVNLTSESESDLRGSAPAGAQGSSQPATTRSPIVESPGDWGFLAAAFALLAIVVQVVWLTRTPGRVEAGRIHPLRPERRGTT
jgi:hypothetical protein